MNADSTKHARVSRDSDSAEVVGVVAAAAEPDEPFLDERAALKTHETIDLVAGFVVSRFADQRLALHGEESMFSALAERGRLIDRLSIHRVDQDAEVVILSLDEPEGDSQRLVQRTELEALLLYGRTDSWRRAGWLAELAGACAQKGLWRDWSVAPPLYLFARAQKAADSLAGYERRIWELAQEARARRELAFEYLSLLRAREQQIDGLEHRASLFNRSRSEVSRRLESAHRRWAPAGTRRGWLADHAVAMMPYLRWASALPMRLRSSGLQELLAARTELLQRLRPGGRGL